MHTLYTTQMFIYSNRKIPNVKQHFVYKIVIFSAQTSGTFGRKPSVGKRKGETKWVEVSAHYLFKKKRKARLSVAHHLKAVGDKKKARVTCDCLRSSVLCKHQMCFKLDTTIKCAAKLYSRRSNIPSFLSIYLSIYLSMILYIYQSSYWSQFVPIYLSISLSMN